MITINEILKLDMYDIVKFYTGLNYRNYSLGTHTTNYSIIIQDRRKLITLIEIRYDGRVSTESYPSINMVYRNISEYLIYLRDKKLNTLLDDN